MNHSHDTTCRYCGYSYRAKDNEPCQNCGKIWEKFRNICVTDTSIANDSIAQLQSSSENTGRSTLLVDNGIPTDAKKIHGLIKGYVENEANNLASYIDDLVADFDVVLDIENTIFFRGVDISIKDHLHSKKIGPSPNPSDGRYNVQNEKCMYLIDNFDFLYSELKDSSKIIAQKYEIPINSFRIANLSPSNNSLHNGLALVFDMAEKGSTNHGYCFENKLQEYSKSKYLVSQLLSSSFKKHDWDGLYIPGVHGGQGGRYHNLVIFNKIIDKWEGWTIGSYFQVKPTTPLIRD